MFELPILVWLAAIGACGALALAIAATAYLRPLQMLACGPLLVLLAGTKLRIRAADASLQADLDWQVALELALYAGLALIVAVHTVSVQLGGRRGFAPARAVGFGYVGFCAVSVFWSLAPQLTIVRSLQLVTLAGLAWNMVGTLGPDRTFDVLRRSVVAYVLVCTAVAFAFPTNDGGRLTWFAVHPITVATLTGVAAVLLLARCLFAGSRPAAAVVSWGLFAAFVGVVLMTVSRGPLFALIASSTFLFVKRTPSAAVRFMLVLALGFTIITALAGGLIERTVLVLASRSGGWIAETILRGQDAEQFLGMTGRVELWESVVPFVVDRPLIGYGYQGSRALLLETASWAAYAHNAYLQTLLEVGLIGAVLLFAPLGWTTSRAVLRPLWRGQETAAGRVAVLLFLLINGMTSESFAAAPGFEIFVVLAATAQPRATVVLKARSAAAFARMEPGLSRSPLPLRR